MTAPLNLWLPPSVRETCARFGRLSPDDTLYVRADEYERLKAERDGLMEAAKGAEHRMCVAGWGVARSNHPTYRAYAGIKEAIAGCRAEGEE